MFLTLRTVGSDVALTYDLSAGHNHEKRILSMISMELHCSWQQITILVLITVIRLRESDCECPDSYWDEPSKLCASPLIVALEHRSGKDSATDPFQINSTCSAWNQTNTCYQHLLSKCIGDVTARREIQMHIGRYRVYSMTCAGNSKYRHRFVDCFLPHIKPTRTCSEAFDRYFRNFVNERQFRNACRVVSSAMKCFHEIKTDVGTTCNEEVADEYERNYIQPLVEQTKDTVTSKCAMSPPYENYFNVAASTPSGESARVPVSVSVALLFARWRIGFLWFWRA